MQAGKQYLQPACKLAVLQAIFHACSLAIKTDCFPSVLLSCCPAICHARLTACRHAFMQAFTVKVVLSSAKGRRLTTFFRSVVFGVSRFYGLENAHDLGGYSGSW